MADKGLANQSLAPAGAIPVISDGSGCAEGTARVWWLPSLTAMSFLLPIVLLYCQVGGPSGLLADPSTGVHIRTGQWILVHHLIPRHDLFSFTFAHRTWCDWEWLSDVVLAVACRLHGLSGVAVLSMALLSMTSVMVYRTARIHTGSLIAGAVSVLAIATTTIHWLTRPHLFTWLLLAVFCWVLEKQPAGARRRWWVLPCIMILWVNLHPGFVAGFLVLGAWLAGSCLGWRFGSTKEARANGCGRATWGLLALAACAAATLVNPYFLHLHEHVALYLFSPSTVTAQVEEWLSPNFHNARLAWFEILLPLAGGAGLWHGLKRRFYWCLLIFGFMHLALQSVRNVPLFAIVCAPPLAAAMEEAFSEFNSGRVLRQAGRVLEGMKSGWGTVAVWVLGVAMIAAIGASPVTLGQGACIPTKAIERLPHGRLFTTDQWADYLVYEEPDRKVFFDGRNDFYGPAFVESYLRVMKAKPGWETILDKYHVSVALIPTDGAIRAALSHDEAWMTAYRDSKATMFFRRKRFYGGRKH